MAIRKIFRNMSQGLPNPGFMQEKIQKGDFLKKGSRELKNWQNGTFEPMHEIQNFFWPKVFF